MRLSTAFIEDFKTRHSVVLGMTRSGKTFLAGKVLQGVQDIGGHTIFVDPKHDDGYAHLGTVCHSPIEVYEQLLRKNPAIVFRTPGTSEERIEALDRMVELMFTLQRTPGFKRIRRVIAIDEIQLFVKKGNSRAVEMIWTIGAGLGIVGMALTQRIQLLNETAWSQSENKVIFRIDDRIDYLKSRNLEHYVNELDFFKDSMNKYWFYYTRGGGKWRKHEPIPLVDPKKNLNLSRF
jgi:DNA helicase HerA-like ATPase|tara:strand:- start:3538 stop:4242 length:705 start_codon:yes stop_codon:yes gene_type:complete